MGFISYCMNLSLYIMSSCLRHYSVCYELNTLDACWIAVDVWSNSSRCRKYRSTCLGRDAYMLDHRLRYRHDFARFYQLLDSNLFTHRNVFAVLREASSEHYGPRVYFTSYFQPYTFTLLHFPPSELTLQSIVKGLTTPL